VASIKIADLIAEARVRTDKAIKEMDQMRRRGDLSTKKMSKGFKKVERDGTRAFTNIGKVAKLAITGIAGAFVAKIAKKIVGTSAQFETLRLRLDQLKGSAEAGGKVFKDLVTFAAKTPFQLQELVEASANLESFGANAEDNIRLMGDLAVFMGITVPEAASAFGRAFAAGAGAADILRDRGVLTLIKMQSGIDDLTKLSLPEFRKVMRDVLADPSGRIAGGTAKLANTIEGKWSTLKDNITLIFKDIGDNYKGGLRGMLDNTIIATGLIRENLKSIGEQIKAEFDLSKAFKIEEGGLAARVRDRFKAIFGGNRVASSIAEGLGKTVKKGINETVDNVLLPETQNLLDEMGKKFDEATGISVTPKIESQPLIPLYVKLSG
jgi:hypothetical protein